MTTTTANYPATTYAATPVKSTTVERVVAIMRLTYGLVAIVAGADKFTHYLVDWNQYLAPQIANMLPIPAHTFMAIVGVIEIIAGLIVLIKPRLGSIIVCLWLLGIAVNLVMTGQYYDVAVRDTVMAIGALSLFMLSKPVYQYKE